jgi:hypothetical protein
MATGAAENPGNVSLANSSLDDLRRWVGSSPLESVLPEFRAGLKGLTPNERFELGREVWRRNDRLAGVMTVAELRMPPRDALRAGPLQPGDAVTDNDTARHFILQTRMTEPTVEPVRGPFYPEAANLPPVDRVLTLAATHIGCQPSGKKQLNLFSLCGALSLNEASRATQKRTTCALFARSVLVAAGDGRFTSAMKKIEDQTDMLRALGLQRDGSEVVSPEWISAIKTPKKPGLKSSDVPNPGDLYYVMIPSAFQHRPPPGGGKSPGDSGHVGIVVKAQRSGNYIQVETIDGGQNPGGLWTTRTLVRAFQQNALGDWEMISHAQVAGETRILLGWVNLGSVAHRFHTSAVLMMDGRTIPTTL